jgi:hypothetical protein
LRLPRADYALSLEVGEHLPEDCLRPFMQQLHRSNRRGILLSWATPAQGGICHISTRPAEAVAREVEGMGYVRADRATEAPASSTSIFTLSKPC